MTSYMYLVCERKFSHHFSLWNHIKIYDNIIDRILQEISEKVEEKVNVSKQLEEEKMNVSEQ